VKLVEQEVPEQFTVF